MKVAFSFSEGWEIWQLLTTTGKVGMNKSNIMDYTGYALALLIRVQ